MFKRTHVKKVTEKLYQKVNKLLPVNKSDDSCG